MVNDARKRGTTLAKALPRRAISDSTAYADTVMPPLILIVDDESTIRDVLGALLTDEGYRVRCAADGEEALDFMVLVDPDVVVCDIRMPRMHGLTLVERVRARGVQVPIILISTWTPPPLPGVRFIRKPFDLDDITKAVAESLAAG